VAPSGIRQTGFASFVDDRIPIVGEVSGHSGFRMQSVLVGDTDSNSTSRLRCRAWSSESDVSLRVTLADNTRAAVPPVGSDANAPWPGLQYVTETQTTLDADILGRVPRWRQERHGSTAEDSFGHVVVFRGAEAAEAMVGSYVSFVDFECTPYACNEVLKQVAVRSTIGSCGSYSLAFEVMDEYGSSENVPGATLELPNPSIHALDTARVTMQVEVEPAASSRPSWRYLPLRGA